MPIQAYVTCKNVDSVSSVKIDEEEVLATLGSEEDALAVQLQELFESVRDSVLPSIKTESQLNMEVTGTVNLKASGGIKYLFLAWFKSG